MENQVHPGTRLADDGKRREMLLSMNEVDRFIITVNLGKGRESEGGATCEHVPEEGWRISMLSSLCEPSLTWNFHVKASM